MERKHAIKPELIKKLAKLLKKNKSEYNKLIIKINEIISSSNIEHYKNLKYGLKSSKRVHIGSFVLIFQYVKENNLVVFEDYDHHDNIYS